MYVINNATDSQQMFIDFLQNRCFKKFRNIRRKTPVLAVT